jgi:hypothetical protein
MREGARHGVRLEVSGQIVPQIPTVGYRQNPIDLGSASVILGHFPCCCSRFPTMLWKQPITDCSSSVERMGFLAPTRQQTRLMDDGFGTSSLQHGSLVQLDLEHEFQIGS